ncbi:MAG TPA: NUDIX domain-containing protein [Actinopolymorphaceae bacterium]|nr:NUDIX domain-containing protein [Actinopolymorphaceae bacterium]
MGLHAERVCAAILRDGRILMVRHVEDTRDFWTLPGGGAEVGETLPEAVLREVAEEVQLAGTVGRLLYERGYLATNGRQVHESCFLFEIPPGAEPTLGYDPEIAMDGQVLAGVAWFDLAAVADDRQVARALPALQLER